MSNKPSFPAESSSDNGQNNAELATNSITSGNNTFAKLFIAPKNRSQLNKELDQFYHYFKLVAIVLISVVGIIITIYASCVYINNTDGKIRLEHIYAIADYLKLHGMPSAIVGFLVWAFSKK